MHLGNGIICPITAIPMIALAGGAIFYSLKQARKNFTKEKILPTVALTIFIFAMQMLNFAIPSVGSSGHIIGSVLLSAILGPYVAFLSMCIILLIQAIFFADGGLLALGCNIFNMGFLACFVAYPLIYKPLEKANKPILASIFASVTALQLGSIFVVAETFLSGTITGNILQFTGLMQFIHFPIGIIEGIFTYFIILTAMKTDFSKVFTFSIIILSVILAGVISKYASTKPDGLEWALLNISDSINYQTQNIFYYLSNSIQTKVSIANIMTPIFANISGIIIISLLTHIISKTLLLKTSETNNYD